MLKATSSIVNVSQITGVLPVVNGGTGVTTSTGTGNTVLSAAPTLSGNVTLSTGNLVIGTAGKGIDFSADPSAPGMTSELFDDYEEGTWTPVATSWTTAPAINAATYTKVGRQVTVTILANGGLISSLGASITGLPFTSGSTGGASVIKDVSGGANFSIGAIGDNSTSIGSLTTVTLTGNFWSLSASYFV
jgi:hypothetical protein